MVLEIVKKSIDDPDCCSNKKIGEKILDLEKADVEVLRPSVVAMHLMSPRILQGHTSTISS